MKASMTNANAASVSNGKNQGRRDGTDDTKDRSPQLRKQARERQILLVKDFCRAKSVAPLVKDSYVLSRAWAWICRIRVSPTVSIPIPRFFTQRDP